MDKNIIYNKARQAKTFLFRIFFVLEISSPWLNFDSEYRIVVISIVSYKMMPQVAMPKIIKYHIQKFDPAKMKFQKTYMVAIILPLNIKVQPARVALKYAQLQFHRTRKI